MYLLLAIETWSSSRTSLGCGSRLWFCQPTTGPSSRSMFRGFLRELRCSWFVSDGRLRHIQPEEDHRRVRVACSTRVFVQLRTAVWLPWRTTRHGLPDAEHNVGLRWILFPRMTRQR